MITINSEIMKDLIEKDLLTFTLKKYKTMMNYYLSPNLLIELNNAELTWFNNKNLSFRFNKYEKLSLKVFLRYVSEVIFNKCCKVNGIGDGNMPYMYYENDHDEYFYIKCYNSNEKFNVRRCTPDKIILEIKNIFKNEKGVYGYNLTLKDIIFY